MAHYLQPLILRPMGAAIFQNAVAAFNESMAQIQEYYRGQLGVRQIFNVRGTRIANLDRPASFYEGSGWDAIITDALRLGIVQPSRTVGYVISVEDVVTGAWGMNDQNGVIAVVEPTGIVDGFAGYQGYRNPSCLRPEPWCARGVVAHEITHVLGLPDVDQPGVNNLTWEWWMYPETVLVPSEQAQALGSPWITDAGGGGMGALLALGGLVGLGVMMAGRGQAAPLAKARYFK